MYRAGIEGILGIRREGEFITIAPRIPAAWPSFEATINLGASRFDISVENAPGGASAAILDGNPVDFVGRKARVHLDGKAHHLALQVSRTKLRQPTSLHQTQT
jgi:cyclic beta-1,2-glucan synthetase